jgi:hypothetical protein
MVTEAEVSDYIEQAHAGSNMPRPPWSRSVYRELLEAGQRHRTGIAAEAQELKQLRRKVAELERFMQNGLLEAVGTELGNMYRQLEDRIKVVENRDPVPLPVPDWNTPTVHYCGLWNVKHLYGPGAMVTKDGACWIAMSAMAAGVKPGDGPTGWRLAVKSDTASVRSIVKDEVRRQLRERT